MLSSSFSLVHFVLQRDAHKLGTRQVIYTQILYTAVMCTILLNHTVYWKQAASLHYAFQPVDVNKGWGWVRWVGGGGGGEKSTNYMILLFLCHLLYIKCLYGTAVKIIQKAARFSEKTAHSWKCFANIFYWEAIPG